MASAPSCYKHPIEGQDSLVLRSPVLFPVRLRQKVARAERLGLGVLAGATWGEGAKSAEGRRQRISATIKIEAEGAMAYLYLAIAIVSEVVGTAALKASEEFTRLVPSVIVIVGYASAFYFLTLTLRTIPVGIAYAVWAGVGIVLICVVSWILYKQTLDMPAIIGVALIAAGVVLINGFSGSINH
jgi:small multidrug resistance pump